MPKPEKRWYIVMEHGHDGFGMIVGAFFVMSNIRPDITEDVMGEVCRSFHLLSYALETMVAVLGCREHTGIMFSADTRIRVAAPGGSNLSIENERSHSTTEF